MVSIQRIAPASSGGRTFTSVKKLKQFAGVALTYTNIARNVPGYMGRNSHKVYGDYICFDKQGKVVDEYLQAECEFTVSTKGKSIVDQLPSDPGTVLVRFWERQGTGEFTGKTFNQMDEIEDDDLREAMITELERREGVASESETDGPPKL